MDVEKLGSDYWSPSVVISRIWGRRAFTAFGGRDRLHDYVFSGRNPNPKTDEGMEGWRGDLFVPYRGVEINSRTMSGLISGLDSYFIDNWVEYPADLGGNGWEYEPGFTEMTAVDPNNMEIEVCDSEYFPGRKIGRMKGIGTTGWSVKFFHKVIGDRGGNVTGDNYLLWTPAPRNHGHNFPEYTGPSGMRILVANHNHSLLRRGPTVLDN